MTTLNRLLGNLFPKTFRMLFSHLSKTAIHLCCCLVLFCASLSAQQATPPKHKLRYNVDSLIQSRALMPDNTNKIAFISHILLVKIYEKSKLTQF